MRETSYTISAFLGALALPCLLLAQSASDTWLVVAFTVPEEQRGKRDAFRERLTEMGENAKDDMKPYITDSRSGGRLYLREFQKLIN